MTKLIKELTKEWKEYKMDNIKKWSEKRMEALKTSGIMASQAHTIPEPTMEGFMDYLTNKEL